MEVYTSNYNTKPYVINLNGKQVTIAMVGNSEDTAVNLIHKVMNGEYERRIKMIRFKDFQKVAKKAVINALGEDINIRQLYIVWFASKLESNKCTIFGKVMDDKWAEATYDRCTNQINVDIYQKISSTKIPSSEFNFTE